MANIHRAPKYAESLQRTRESEKGDAPLAPSYRVLGEESDGPRSLSGTEQPRILCRATTKP